VKRVAGTERCTERDGIVTFLKEDGIKKKNPGQDSGIIRSKD